MNDLILVLTVSLYIAGVYIAPIYLYKKGKISKQCARSLIHFFSGFSIISLYFAQNKLILFFAALFITFIVFMSRKKTPILKHAYEAIAEEEEIVWMQGPVLYGISIAYLILFSMIFESNIIPLASALILTISDPIAAFVGRRYGKAVFKMPVGSKRTFQGSFAMVVSNFFIISMLFGFGAKALAISFILAVIEIISPSKADDLTLPLAASLLLINY